MEETVKKEPMLLYGSRALKGNWKKQGNPTAKNVRSHAHCPIYVDFPGNRFGARLKHLRQHGLGEVDIKEFLKVADLKVPGYKSIPESFNATKLLDVPLPCKLCSNYQKGDLKRHLKSAHKCSKDEVEELVKEAKQLIKKVTCSRARIVDATAEEQSDGDDDTKEGGEDREAAPRAKSSSLY